MIHKSYLSEVKDLDNKGRVMVAANAFGNEDSDGDVSAEGSFKKTLKEFFHRVKWFKDHDKTTLIGVPIEGSEKGNYLQLIGQLNMEKQVSRDVYSDYKLYAEYGKTLEHSIGGIAMKRDQKDSRIITEWKLYEYSTLSSWGANENTPMLGIKSHNNLMEQLAWADLQLRKGDYSDEKFKRIETLYKELSSLVLEPEQAQPAQAAANNVATPAIVEPDEKQDGNGDELLFALRLLNGKI